VAQHIHRRHKETKLGNEHTHTHTYKRQEILERRQRVVVEEEEEEEEEEEDINRRRWRCLWRSVVVLVGVLFLLRVISSVLHHSTVVDMVVSPAYPSLLVYGRM